MGKGAETDITYNDRRICKVTHLPPFSSCKRHSGTDTPHFRVVTHHTGYRHTPFSSSKCKESTARLVLTPELLQPFADNRADSRLFVS